MKVLNTLGDRLLSKFVPQEVAHADRYRCAWGSYCLGNRLHYCYCCIDDYTGQIVSCSDCEFLNRFC